MAVPVLETFTPSGVMSVYERYKRTSTVHRHIMKGRTDTQEREGKEEGKIKLGKWNENKRTGVDLSGACPVNKNGLSAIEIADPVQHGDGGRSIVDRNVIRSIIARGSVFGAARSPNPLRLYSFHSGHRARNREISITPVD